MVCARGEMSSCYQTRNYKGYIQRTFTHENSRMRTERSFHFSVTIALQQGSAMSRHLFILILTIDKSTDSIQNWVSWEDDIIDESSGEGYQNLNYGETIQRVEAFKLVKDIFLFPAQDLPPFFFPLMTQTHKLRVGGGGCLPSEQTPIVKNKT